MKTALIALLMFCACGGDDDSGSGRPDAGIDAYEARDCFVPWPEWRSCDWPFVEGGDCDDVCCEDDDTWTNQPDSESPYRITCSVSGRQCGGMRDTGSGSGAQP